MTTAHRPTWAPAKGGEEQGGTRLFAPSRMQSVKDLPAQTQMKFRQDGQSSAADLQQKDLRRDLEEKERQHFLKSKGAQFEDEREEDLRLLEAGVPAGGGGTAGGPRLIPKAVDADDEDDEEDESDDSDDDEDEEAELLAELDRIKRERAEEAARKAAEEAAAADSEVQRELLHGNPLLQEKLAAAAAGAGGSDGSFAVKRRWDDDVVFRNQARGEAANKQPKFVNDVMRSQFHRRFMDRYMK